MPGNGNGGGSAFSNVNWPTTTTWGEGERQQTQPGSELTRGEGASLKPFDLSPLVKKKEEPKEPEPRQPVIREARNVQRANIDRSSYYDPSVATLSMGAEYLSSRNATNPITQGDTGVGAVGYETPDGDIPDKLY